MNVKELCPSNVGITVDPFSVCNSKVEDRAFRGRCWTHINQVGLELNGTHQLLV
jgi:hypothetical protein